jgi:hypothetical protein
MKQSAKQGLWQRQQIVALIGVIIFVGYLGLTSFPAEQTPSVLSISPTTQE